MIVVVAAFNQEKALVGAFSVITNLRMDLFEALISIAGCTARWLRHGSSQYSAAKFLSTLLAAEVEISGWRNKNLGELSY